MTDRFPTFRAVGRWFGGLFGGIRALNVMDDRYWSPVTSALSTSGIRITPEVAFMCSCLYQGTRLIAETVASLPIRVYRETGEDTKELARTNPLWDLLRRRPNAWQTPTEFYQVMTAHASSGRMPSPRSSRGLGASSIASYRSIQTGSRPSSSPRTAGATGSPRGTGSAPPGRSSRSRCSICAGSGSIRSSRARS